MSLVLGGISPVVLALLVSVAPGAAAAPRGEFDWPLRPRPAVVRAFDKPEHDWLPGHRGVDLAAGTGRPVLAAGSGVVVFAGVVAGKPVISIDHAGGLRTTYEPVTASIPVGRKVTRGAPLGTLSAGHEGCPTSACLHWGVRRGHDYLNPLALIQRAPLRLKPITRQ
ncbi:M23 family metallopeptidase [Nocardia sp. 2]|uniref:M23 family metallopeptidase n=2 Tax=Nocardia acididurans TaxID=2802282 RepID=A0ABS1MEU9_9NOCA|nr:peptidoglycan DD-metalloendopeptidase family protein [Nocardia acididurans]MBL1079076.1 M23 family metallopeptidase [Nocardia acididurans]